MGFYLHPEGRGSTNIQRERVLPATRGKGVLLTSRGKGFYSHPEGRGFYLHLEEMGFYLHPEGRGFFTYIQREGGSTYIQREGASTYIQKEGGFYLHPEGRGSTYILRERFYLHPEGRGFQLHPGEKVLLTSKWFLIWSLCLVTILKVITRIPLLSHLLVLCSFASKGPLTLILSRSLKERLVTFTPVNFNFKGQARLQVTMLGSFYT